MTEQDKKDLELGRLVRAMRAGQTLSVTLGGRWIGRYMSGAAKIADTPEEALRAEGVGE